MAMLGTLSELLKCRYRQSGIVPYTTTAYVFGNGPGFGNGYIPYWGRGSGSDKYRI